jgi:integrase/recombinase XerD
MMDTGVRIQQALTLKRRKVDFDNCLITVKGKGNKERTIPFSVELRKRLRKFTSQHSFELVFCTKPGTKLLYDRMRRDFQKLMTKLGIKGFDSSFHCFRRTIARNYVRSGGNLFYLQKSLGHTTLTMSRRYVELETEDLQEMHTRTSLLNKLR